MSPARQNARFTLRTLIKKQYEPYGMARNVQYERADTTTHGTILMVAIAVLLGILLLALFLGLFSPNHFNQSLAPEIIKIIGINHGGSKLESRVTIRSFAAEELENDTLMAIIRVNGEKLLARILTLHGTDFIPTHHYGVKTIGGSGCRGHLFSPRETIVIDLKNGYIRPGDVVELVIYKKSDDTSAYPVGNLLDEKYMERYQEEYIFHHIPGYRIYSQHQYTA